MQETNLIEQEQPVGMLAIPVPAPAPTMTLCSYGAKLTREELARVATPVGTATHKPIPHIAVVEKLIEALGFRQIGVVQEEYAVSSDGMRMFGVMDLSSGFQGCRFAIGLRNSHDKSFRLSCTVGLQGFRVREPCVPRGIHTCLGEAFEALLSRRQFGHRRRSDAEELRTAEAAGRGMAGDATVSGFGKATDLPGVHRGRIWGFPSTWRGECTICTFSPCMRSFSREPCGACRMPSPARFKELEPIPQYKATAKLAGFLQSVRPS